MPHVRLRVRGPKMIFFECFQLDGLAAPNGFSLTDSLKRSWGFAPLIRPTYAPANVGHPSSFLMVLLRGEFYDYENLSAFIGCERWAILSDISQKRTSGAKAPIDVALCGTAEAVPFVQGVLVQSWLSLCCRRGGAYCVQLLDRRVIQLQPGGLDQVGQVLVIGGAGNGSSYAGLHH